MCFLFQVRIFSLYLDLCSNGKALSKESGDDFCKHLNIDAMERLESDDE